MNSCTVGMLTALLTLHWTVITFVTDYCMQSAAAVVSLQYECHFCLFVLSFDRKPFYSSPAISSNKLLPTADCQLPAILIQNCYSRMSKDLLRLWGLIGSLGNRKSMPNGQVATNTVLPCAKLQTCVLSVTSNPERRKIKPNTKFGGLTAVCDAVSLVVCFPMFRTIVLPPSSGPEGNTIYRNVWTAGPATRHHMSREVKLPK
jgi:hypothetical protein